MTNVPEPNLCKHFLTENDPLYLKLLPDEEARAEALRVSLDRELVRADENVAEKKKFESLHGFSRGFGNKTVWWNQTAGIRTVDRPDKPSFRFPSKVDYEAKCLISSTKMNMFELLQCCLTEEQLQSIEHLRSDLAQVEVSSNGSDYDDRTGECTDYEFDVFRHRTFDKPLHVYYNHLLSYGNNCQDYINKLAKWNEIQESNLVILYTAVDRADRAEFEKLSEKYGKKESES